MVQPHRVGNDLRQAPGARDDGAHNGVVGAMVGVLGLDKAAILTRHGFHQSATVALHTLQHHRNAHMKKQATRLGHLHVHAVQLLGNVGHGQGAAGG